MLNRLVDAELGEQGVVAEPVLLRKIELRMVARMRRGGRAWEDSTV